MKPRGERQIHVRLPVEIYKALRIRCVNEDKSIQDYVEEILEKALRIKARAVRGRGQAEVARGR